MAYAATRVDAEGNMEERALPARCADIAAEMEGDGWQVWRITESGRRKVRAADVREPVAPKLATE